jgi:hypothetical protein
MAGVLDPPVIANCFGEPFHAQAEAADKEPHLDRLRPLRKASLAAAFVDMPLIVSRSLEAQRDHIELGSPRHLAFTEYLVDNPLAPRDEPQ